MSALKLALIWSLFVVFALVGFIYAMRLHEVEPAKDASPEAPSGRASIMQSIPETPASTDPVPYQRFTIESIPKQCLTVEEIKEVLRIKASQKRTKR